VIGLPNYIRKLNCADRHRPASPFSPVAYIRCCQTWAPAVPVRADCIISGQFLYQKQNFPYSPLSHKTLNNNQLTLWHIIERVLAGFNHQFNSMIELKRISKWVNVGGKPNFILKDINLQIKEGEFVSIMGPSGSGKSSLLNIVGMLDDASEGEYFFLNQAVHTLKEKQRSQLYKQYIGFVFQAYHLIDELTVYENIETPLIYQNIKGSERQAMVADILDRFQIVGKKDLFPTQLSGGQQQLVGIARALIGKPKLLLADEPTGNLNSRQGEEIMDLFKQLNNEGVTIIQVTHSEKNAAYGSRIINLLDGRVDNN
jgi:ABC-type lipoprotein export system ATPase subunit